MAQQIINMANIYPLKNRKILITKNKSNTHYSIYVIDGYGTEHHLGYSSVLNEAFHKEIHRRAEKIWNNEVKPKEDLLANAIKECVEIDKKSFHFTDSRGNHRDGLD